MGFTASILSWHIEIGETGAAHSALNVFKISKILENLFAKLFCFLFFLIKLPKNDGSQK